MRRSEYPRPHFVRDQWQSLNGEWEFAFDDGSVGVREGWERGGVTFPLRIQVPFVYQSQLGGIHDQSFHPVLWYQRRFAIPEAWAGKRVLLHFGAVDYQTTVWVNGRFAGMNRGGYVPFSFDITDLLQPGEQLLVVRVEDYTHIDQPLGKQSARAENWGCWYTRVSGIWQSVWIEPVADLHLTRLYLTPDIDAGTVTVEYGLSHYEPGYQLQVELVASLRGREVVRLEVPVEPLRTPWVDPGRLPNGKAVLPVVDPELWTPEHPALYDLEVALKRDGQVVDRVQSYFGMRKIAVQDGKILLNHRPYYLRMVLDQGFWPNGVYTPGDVAAFEHDVRTIKAMGFNGVRMHQKIEDPYFLYYCDRLGLLVWSEMPSWYGFGPAAIESALNEWQRVIRRDYNHPCVMAWVPVNESWGVDPLGERGTRQRQAAAVLQTLYYLTKALDPTRLVVSNDGWQQAATDLVTIHEYTQDTADLSARLQRFLKDKSGAPFTHGRPILLPEVSYAGQPILVTEFGGCKVAAQGTSGWGYGEAVADYEQMLERVDGLVKAIRAQSEIAGFCYTQLTDVEQEVNGLLYADHTPKMPVERLKAVFEQ